MTDEKTEDFMSQSYSDHSVKVLLGTGPRAGEKKINQSLN